MSYHVVVFICHLKGTTVWCPTGPKRKKGWGPALGQPVLSGHRIKQPRRTMGNDDLPLDGKVELNQNNLLLRSLYHWNTFGFRIHDAANINRCCGRGQTRLPEPLTDWHKLPSGSEKKTLFEFHEIYLEQILNGFKAENHSITQSKERAQPTDWFSWSTNSLENEWKRCSEPGTTLPLYWDLQMCFFFLRRKSIQRTFVSNFANRQTHQSMCRTENTSEKSTMVCLVFLKGRTTSWWELFWALTLPLSFSSPQLDFSPARGAPGPLASPGLREPGSCISPALKTYWKTNTQ